MQEILRTIPTHAILPSLLFGHAELLRMTIDILSADFKVCASFSYAPLDSLHTQIFVYGGRDDEIDESALTAWSQETSAITKLQMFEGGHFFIRENEAYFLRQLHDSSQELTCCG